MALRIQHVVRDVARSSKGHANFARVAPTGSRRCDAKGTCKRVGLSRPSQRHVASSSRQGIRSWKLNASVMSGPLIANTCSKNDTLAFSSRRAFHRAVTPSSGGQSTPNADGIVDFLLADIGEGIAEVEIMQWFVKEGDTVEQFQKVCEVQSDKATVEITSRFDGQVVELCYKVEDMAKVGMPLMKLKTAGAAAAPAPSGEEKAAQASASGAPSSVSSAENASGAAASRGGKVLTTPAVRRLARENNLTDLESIPATGPKGRLLKEDVVRFLAGGASTSASAPAPSSAPTAAAAAAAASSPPSSSSSPQAAPPALTRPLVQGKDVVQKVSGIQRVMVQTMVKAAAVPTFLYCDEIEMDAVMAARNKLKPIAEKQNIKLSYMPLIIKALSLALTQYPKVNATVNDDCTELTMRAAHNISIAMDTPRGLLVPNIKNVEQLSVFEVAAELNRLQDLGSRDKLGPKELSGGTVSLSNIGAIGGTYAQPILLVPQVAIAAMGKIQKVPRFDSQGNVVSKSIMTISWSADHRVLDGAYVCRMSNLMRDYIQDPLLMLSQTK